MKGQKRCYKHGGASLWGVANPNWKGGRHSRILPTRMLPTAEEAASDPDLHSLRDAMIVTDSRIADLISRVDSGESGALWRKLKEALKEYDKADRTKDTDLKVYWWAELHDLINHGAADYDAWDEVQAAQQHQLRLMTAERKRIVELHAIIDSNEALSLFAALLEIVRDKVRDRSIMAEISRDASKLLRGNR